MKNEFDTYLTRAGEEFSLTPEERERMRGVLRAYMELTPIRSAAVRPAFTTLAWWLSPRPIAAALAAAVFASSAGVSYAAENALPGDVLYAVKTGINEPVQGALALSASAHAAWAMQVAGERVQEAAALAAEGRLSSSTQSEIQASFDAHASQAIADIDTEASTSPDVGAEAAVAFQAQLSGYRHVLAEVAQATNADVGPLTASIDTQNASVASVRAGAERTLALATTTDKAIAASRMRDAAQTSLSASAKLARAAFSSLASSSAQSVQEQLQSVGNIIASGEQLLGGNSPDAIGAFQSALATTEQLGAYLQTSSAIHAHTGLVIAQPDTRASDSGSVRTMSAPARTAAPMMKTEAAPMQPAAEPQHFAPAAPSSSQPTSSEPQSSVPGSSVHLHASDEDSAAPGEMSSAPAAPSAPSEVRTLQVALPDDLHL